MPADIIVFDFETYGLDPQTSEAIQVAGKAYRGYDLEPYPPEAGGEFSSLMRPLYPERLDEPSAKRALEINKKTKEDILAAPDQAVVWNQFVSWVGKYNPKKSAWTAPIASGYNIKDFDFKFVAALNELHCKGDRTVLFAKMPLYDLQDDIRRWFGTDPDWENFKLDTVRKKFGLSLEGAHDALVDVRDTGFVMMKFLKLYERLRNARIADGSPLIKFFGNAA